MISNDYYRQMMGANDHTLRLSNTGGPVDGCIIDGCIFWSTVYSPLIPGTGTELGHQLAAALGNLNSGSTSADILP